MKRIILIVLMSMILGHPAAFSQQKPFVFGFKAGPNLGWLRPDSKGYERDGMRAGFSWGFVADFFLMENYGIATGFDVVFLNGALEIPHEMSDGAVVKEGTLSRKYMLKYIQVPVTLRMRTNELGKFRVFGQIGLGTNFLIGAKADDEFTPANGEPVSDEVDIYNDITFMYESLIVGAGAEYSLGGSTMLTACIVFNNGFMDILKGENTRNPAINNKAYANYLSLDIGIVF